MKLNEDKKNTMKSIYTLLISCFIGQVYAQTGNIDPCAIFKEAVSNNNIDTLDHYLNMDDTQLDLNDRINLMTFKGLVLIRKQGKRRSERGKTAQAIVDSSYQLFTDALNMVEDENLKIGYRMRRYETLSEMKIGYPSKSEDEYLLRQSGYKPDQTGFSLMFTSRYDGEFWLGAEVALFGGLQLPFNFKNGYGDTVEKMEMGVSGSAFIFSHTRNMESAINESKFSILRIEAPIYVDITQVGWMRTAGRSYWFYRPQVGLGYGRFSLSYGFSLFFKKEARDLLNRHSLDFKTKFVF